MSIPAPLSGRQFVLDNGTVRAEIGSLAAVLRSVSVGGTQITEPVGTDVIAPMGCGIVLAPWPNRVRDGAWVLEGTSQQLDLTEVSRHNAIHGLLRNTVYNATEVTPTSVTLAATISPQHGWPFLIDTWVRFSLDDDGISVTHGAHNRSERISPWAVGAHPYFRVGDAPVEELELTITGTSWMELDDRLLPVAEQPISGHPVAGSPWDLTGGRPVGELNLNTAYSELANSLARADVAWLRARDGATTTLWMDSAFRWIQSYSPPDFPRPDGTGLAIALEPMSAPADALNSGTDLIWLQPDQEWEASWGVRFTPGDA